MDVTTRCGADKYSNHQLRVGMFHLRLMKISQNKVKGTYYNVADLQILLGNVKCRTIQWLANRTRFTRFKTLNNLNLVWTLQGKIYCYNVSYLVIFRALATLVLQSAN